jgi:hypothetical protein
MYEDVERCFQSPSLAAYFDRSWLSHTQLKSSVYDVEALAQVLSAPGASSAVVVACGCE